LEIDGRLDDIIITGGHNVAPVAVERLISGVAGVTDACVVGVPDDEWGQRVVALVVRAVAATREPGSLVTLPDCDAVVRQELGPPAAPKLYFQVPSLPALDSGKVDRRAAARLAASLVTEQGAATHRETSHRLPAHDLPASKDR